MFGKIAGAWLGSKVAGRTAARRAPCLAMERRRWRGAACRRWPPWRSAVGVQEMARAARAPVAVLSFGRGASSPSD